MKENLSGQTSFDDIKIYYNIFSSSEIQKIQKYLSRPKWKFGHYSDSAKKHKCFWNMNLSDEEYFNTYLYSIITDLTQNKTTAVERIYANGQTYGLDGSLHIDNLHGYTFLYYANLEWYPEWSGNTVFCDKKTNSKKYFYPEPNSAIFFPGNLLHYGQSPSRDFYGLRTTIAYKLL